MKKKKLVVVSQQSYVGRGGSGNGSGSGGSSGGGRIGSCSRSNVVVAGRVAVAGAPVAAAKS